MAYAMTKQGSLDNCVTYEFMCDTVADMNAIEDRYRTIGTVAIVLSGESGMEVYIAGSNKQWNSLSSIGGGTTGGDTAGLVIHICAQDEVSNGLPDIAEPDETTVYLVAAGNTTGNLYEEYIYVDGAWEKFGAASIDLSNYIQKTDIATQSTAGLVKVLDNGNVTFNENNQLVLTLAGTAVVKTGQSDHPISVTHQHEAAFYGLAKAAGQDMKNSNNAVGTYTTEAAGAIRTMIGAGTYNKPAGGIPAADLASGVIPDVSGFAPKDSPVFTSAISMGRLANSTIGTKSVAIGENVTASGYNSYAEGTGGSGSLTINNHVYQGSGAHGQTAHSEGNSTWAIGQESHAEGRYTQALDTASHSEGDSTKAAGVSSHAEGNSTYASSNAHAEGYYTSATNDSAHSEGQYTQATGNASHAEGEQTQAKGNASHAEGHGGTYTKNNVMYTSGALGQSDHTEGYQTRTESNQPGNHAEGYRTSAIGGASHAEGNATTASGNSSHSEGASTIASNYATHAEGASTTASGTYAHAEGLTTIADGEASHAEGWQTKANLKAMHAGGQYNIIYPNWSGGSDYKVDDLVVYNNVLYKCKTANSDTIFNSNKWIDWTGFRPMFVIGNGSQDSSRSNACTIDIIGNEYLKGDVYVGCNPDSTGGTKLPRIPAAPFTDGTYILQTTVTNGTPTYTWVSLTNTNIFSVNAAT